MRQSHALAVCSSAPLLLALLLLAAVSFSAPSVAKELYRWIDENGVTHYSDTKPAGVEVERRAIAADPIASAPAKTADEADEAAQASKTPPKAKVTPEQCARAAANIANLGSGQEILLDSDGDGVPEPLDAAGRQIEIDRNNAYIERYCGSAEEK